MRLGGCILVAAALISAVAEADNNDQARKHFVNLKLEEAKALIDRREFRPAIAILEATYAATKSPTVLFNLGGVHDYIGRTTGNEKERRIALDYFRRFVEAAPNAPERSEAERIIGELVLALKLDTKPPEEVAKTTPPPQEPVRTTPPQEPPKTTTPDETAKTSPPPGAPEKPVPRVESPKRNPPRTSPVAACPAPTPPPAPPFGQIASASPSIPLTGESYRDAGFKHHQHRAVGRSQLGDHAGAIAEYLAAHNLIPKPEVLCSIAAETIQSCNKMAGEEDAIIGCLESARDFYRSCADSDVTAESPSTTSKQPAIEKIIKELDGRVEILQSQKEKRLATRATRQRASVGVGIAAAILSGAALATGLTLNYITNERRDQLLARPESLTPMERQESMSTLGLRSDAATGLMIASGGCAVAAALLLQHLRPDPVNKRPATPRLLLAPGPMSIVLWGSF